MGQYTGSPPTFTTGQKTGTADGLNNLRDFVRVFSDAQGTYTPTLTASTTNPTGWTATGRFFRAGKLVVATFALTAGGSMTAGSGTYRISLPATAQTAIGNAPIGTVQCYDASTGTTWLQLAQSVAGTYLQLQQAGVGAGYVSNSSPWTWAAGDQINGQIIYEAA